MYITTQLELEEFVAKLEGSPWLVLDTEFVREKTYFHILGLIQVSANGVCGAIDPIKIDNLEALLRLIRDPKILKIFHAARQDLEILNRLCPEGVQPVFDTQAAAAMVGWGAQISFAKLVHKVTGKRMHKTETYSDWCRRPLSQKQIDYALDDVRYLVPVYEKLVKKLGNMNRLEWLEAELKDSSDKKRFQLPDPYLQYRKIKNIRGLKPRILAVLRELAAWRETEAMQRNCLAKFIIRDEPLLEIARSQPDNPSALSAIRGFHPKEIKQSAEAIFSLIQKGMNLPEEELPILPDSDIYNTRPGVENLLASYVQIRGEEMKIEANVLADRKMIHQFVRGFELGENLDDLPVYQNWRKEMVGDRFYSILCGEKGLFVNSSGNLALVDLPKSGS